MSEPLNVEVAETRVSTCWFTARAANMTLGDFRAIVVACEGMADETRVTANRLTESVDKNGVEFSTLRLRHERKVEDSDE